MKDRLWTKQYLLVIVTNFLLYVVYYQLMLWTTSYAMHIWKADVSEAGLAAGLFIISALVARLLAGHFIDGLGRGFVLRCGTALYAASMLLYFFITLKTVESTLSQIRRRRARGTSGLWPSSP